ncbi:MAG: hypothetical protein HQL06_08080 [Nitrospirae bacterium]|nr:hypothetical protein [Nitrospirota bacterium]
MAYYIFSASLNAQWYIIDDHEIMNFLGPDKHVSLFNIPSLIENTEIMSLDIHPRYRPVHWLIVIFESWLWGEHPFRWYLFKMMVFILFASVMWWVTQHYIGFAYSGIFTLFVLSQNYWVDIWTKLGAPEVNAALGLALYSAGYFAVLKNTASNTDDEAPASILCWILITVGAVVAMGSKENFLILLLPQICLSLYLLVKGKLNSHARFATSIIIVFGLLMAAMIAYLIKRHGGSDFYSKSADFTDRLGVFVSLITSFLTKIHSWGLGNTFLIVVASVFLGVIFILGLVIFKQKGTGVTGQYFSAISKTAGLLLILAIIVISQIIFYNGYWPADNRFDFPGKLAFPVAFLSIILSLLKILDLLGVTPKTITPLKIIIAAVFLLIVIQRGFIPLREATQKHALITTEFTDKIQYISDILNKQPQTPLVFESHNVWDYEPIFSVERFLSVNKVKNPLFLRTHGYKPTSKMPANQKNTPLLPEFENKLAKELTEISSRGSLPVRNTGQFTRFMRNPFLPLKDLKEDQEECLSLGFSGDTGGNCKYLMRLW